MVVAIYTLMAYCGSIHGTLCREGYDWALMIENLNSRKITLENNFNDYVHVIMKITRLYPYASPMSTNVIYCMIYIGYKFLYPCMNDQYKILVSVNGTWLTVKYYKWPA